MSSASRKLKCMAIGSDGSCPCREYREAENPDPDRPIRCLECLHGRSLHEPRDSERPTSSVLEQVHAVTVPQNPTSEASKESNNKSASSSEVNSILQKYLGGSRALESNGSSTDTDVIQVARQETNKGMKRGSENQNITATTSKGNGKSK
ncbi:hypothetical protein H0H92_013078, partial [Tricholoma furcatifolium]